MLPINREKFEHRLKTIIGHLRTVLKVVHTNPSTSYGHLRSIEKSVQQASMFIIKDLLDELAVEKGEKKKKLVNEFYDCLGFHRDELPVSKKQDTR